MSEEEERRMIKNDMFGSPIDNILLRANAN